MQLELTEEEAVILEVIIHESLLDLANDINYADDIQDWPEVDALLEEYELMSNLIDEIRFQSAQEVYV